MLNFKVKKNGINVNSSTPLADYLRTLGITEVNEFISNIPEPALLVLIRAIISPP